MSELSEYLRNMTNQIEMSYKYLGEKFVIDQDTRKTHTYKVTLKYDNKSLSIKYWCGAGITEVNLADVINCVLVDYNSCENVFFEEFCRELGYNSDSRLHEQIYKSCKENSKKAKRVFGEALLSALSQLEH